MADSKKAKAETADEADVRAVKNAAKALVDQVETTTERANRGGLATPEQEAAMRKEALSASARKEALAAGKKDPIEKFGDPDIDPDTTSGRRAAFGL